MNDSDLSQTSVDQGTVDGLSQLIEDLYGECGQCRHAHLQSELDTLSLKTTTSESVINQLKDIS